VLHSVNVVNDHSEHDDHSTHNSDHKEHKHKHSMPNHIQMMEWDISGVLHQDNLEALGLLPV